MITKAFTMKITPYQDAPYWSDFVARKHDGPFIGSIFARADPHIAIQRTFHSQAAGNAFDYKNPEFDRLIGEASAIYDVSKAKEIYRKIETMIAQESGVVFHLYEPDLYGIRDNVRNFATYPDRELRVREFWLER